MEFGPFSDRFSFYRWEKDQGTPWCCFSIHVFFPMRTVDIECGSARELRMWFLGLQSLIPIWASFYVSPGELMWSQVNMKVDQLAMDLGVSRPKAYVMLENGEVVLEDEERAKLTKRESLWNRLRRGSRDL